MNISKEFILTCFGVFAFVIFLSITQLFFRKERAESEVDGRFVLAYGVLILSWVFSFSILNYISLSILIEFSDSLYRVKIIDPELNLITTGVLFTGLTNIWIFFCYLIVNTLSFLYSGKRKCINEIQSNNYVYFLLKGGVFVGLVFSLLPVFELVLRLFVPEVEIPFYR